MSNGKDIAIILMAGLIKNSYKMIQCFPPYGSFRESI